MKIKEFGKRLLGPVSGFLLAAVALLIARAAWADTVANNQLHSMITTHDVGLMLLSGIGLMAFVARHRRKDGRDGDQ